MKYKRTKEIVYTHLMSLYLCLFYVVLFLSLSAIIICDDIMDEQINKHQILCNNYALNFVRKKN